MHIFHKNNTEVLLPLRIHKAGSRLPSLTPEPREDRAPPFSTKCLLSHVRSSSTLIASLF